MMQVKMHAHEKIEDKENCTRRNKKKKENQHVDSCGL
jgi:hypothetical protein